MINKRAFFLGAILAAQTLCVAQDWTAEPGGDQDPINPTWATSDYNVIIVNLDDAGRSQFSQYDDLNRWPSANHPYAKMPYLTDRMEERGVRFIQARTTARCAPSRAANLTGRQPHISSVHPEGTRVGNIPQQGGLQAPFTTTEGVTSEMRPWPLVAKDAGSEHFFLHVGKVHCTEWELIGTAAFEVAPFDQVVTEIGFDKAYKTELGPQGNPTEPYRGYKNFDAVIVDADGTTTQATTGDAYITDWELNNIKAELINHWTVDDERPFVLQWWTNSPHQNMPAVDVTSTPGWGRTPRTATFSFDELVPGNRSVDGKVQQSIIDSELGGDYATYGPGYDENGVWQGGPTLGEYGPHGAVNVVWRRHLAQLEQWDAYIDELDNWILENYPKQHSKTIWIFHTDNGEQMVAATPLTDPAFTHLGPEYAVIPPTNDGTPFGVPYHDHTRAKSQVYDEGLLIPLIVFGDPVAADRRGQDSSILTDSTDWYGSILDMIAPDWRTSEGSAAMDLVDSKTWTPTLFFDNINGRGYGLYQLYEPAPAPEGSLTKILRCVVSKDGFKLMRRYDPVESIDEWLLFDLNADPNELVNLYNSPAHASTKTRMVNRYLALIGNLD